MESEFFLYSNSTDILALCETSMDDSIDSDNFSVRVHNPLIQKDSATHKHNIPVWKIIWEKEFLLHGTFSRKLCGFLHVFYWLYFNQCLTSFSSIDDLRLSARFLILFYLTDEVLSINPIANVFVFRDFSVHHKDWLTYSGGTDRTGEVCYNFKRPYSDG